MIFNIILFAMIGAMLKATTAYWVIFAIYCTIKALEIVCRVIKVIGEHS